MEAFIYGDRRIEVPQRAAEENWSTSHQKYSHDQGGQSGPTPVSRHRRILQDLHGFSAHHSDSLTSRLKLKLVDPVTAALLRTAAFVA
jgi:hypothetical protein